MSKRTFAKSGRLVVALLIAASCLPARRSKSDEPAKAEKPAADSMLGNEAGQVRDDNGLKMKMVWCPPGFFDMGRDEPADGKVPTDAPVKVQLTRGYWLGKYEVTQAEWKLVLATEPWKGMQFVKEGDDFPAAWITWNDTAEFCRKLTQEERKAGRLPDDWEYTLPTEAQWERACRARTDTKFSFGDDESKLGEYAWFIDNVRAANERYPHQVGQKKPNAWGLYDMHGNVWEWCRDSFAVKLPGGLDPEVTGKGSGRVFRGASLIDKADDCRSAIRSSNAATFRVFGIGFRVALTPVQPPK